MTPSLDLFHLIKSLTPTEKAYFKKFSSFTKQQKEKNVYLVLFDAIAGQDVYDEAKIKKRFQNEAFIRQLPVVKNYLYSRILDALSLYHSEMNDRVTIRNAMNKAEVLRKKGLYDQAMKVVKKTKVLAKEREMHLALLDMIIHIEQGLALEKYDMDWFEKVNEEMQGYLALMKNDAAMHELNFKAAVYYHKYLSTRKTIYLTQLKEVMQSKPLKDVSFARTFFGRNRFYETHAFYSVARGDIKGVYDNMKKIIENYENTPGMVQRNYNSYVSALNNFINYCGELRKNEEGLLALGKMTALPHVAQDISVRSKVFYVYNYLYLFLNNNSGNFAEAGKRIQGILEELNAFEAEMNDSEKAMLFVNMAISYFGLGDLKASIRWLNKIRNELDMQNHPELDCFVRLFFLIVHYESQNNELIPYLIQSGYRFFTQKMQAYELETTFLDHLKFKISRAKTREDRIAAFRELKKKFTPLVNRPHERAYFKYFDFLSWIEGRIREKSYAEILQSRKK